MLAPFRFFLALSLLSFVVTTADENVAPRWNGKPSRSICDASINYLEDSYDSVLDIVSKSRSSGVLLHPDNLEHPVISKFEKGQLDDTFFHEFKDQNVPSKIVKMELSEASAHQGIEDLKKMKEIQTRIQSILGVQRADGQAYRMFHLEFDSAVLFMPSCLSFWKDNRDKVRATFPEVHSCQCNTFTVQANQFGTGLHKASSTGYESPPLSARGWFQPRKHMSFHTALNPTNSTASPFLIFDGDIPTVYGPGHLLTSMKESTWRPDITRLVRAARLAIAAKSIPFELTMTLLQFTQAAYAHVTHCSSQEEDENDNNNNIKMPGTYWELEPGESIYFNNWRLHSDHKFGSQDYSRYTLDLRCVDKMEIPFPFTDEYDFFKTLFPDVSLMQDTAIGCLLKLFGYQSEKDFYDFIEVVDPKPISYAQGSVLLNYVNTGNKGLLSDALHDGMLKHAERVRHLYDSGELDYASFATCIEDNRDVLAAIGTPNPGGMAVDLSWKSFGPNPTPLSISTRLIKLGIVGARIGLGARGEMALLSLIVMISLVLFVQWRLKVHVRLGKVSQKKVHQE